MAALTATDWTVSVQDRNIEGKKKRNRVSLTLATAGTYPSGGIPLPTAGKLGLVRNVDYIIITDNEPLGTNTIAWHSDYDQNNHKLVLRKMSTASIVAQDFVQLPTTVTAGAGGPVWYIEAVGW